MYIQIIYCVVTLLWVIQSNAFSNRSFMTYRPQEFDLARHVAGWQDLRTAIFNGCATGNISAVLEYERSFNASAINRYFFGADQLVFSGSRRTDRGPCDIMADYFGLPTDFKSILSFDPHIQNAIIDFDFLWNLDKVLSYKGFNLRINAPLVFTSWALNPCEQVIDSGTSAYPAGYMSNFYTSRDALNTQALDVLSYCQTFSGDLLLPLQYGRISTKSLHATKLSDILIAPGYTIVRNRNYLVGVNLQLVIPTGTRTHAQYLFEPQIGNNHHWALGAGLTARYDMFCNEAHDLKIYACLDAAVQHLFKTNEIRSYDLKKNGPGSRYMLLEDMVNGVAMGQGFDGGTVPVEQQYITRLIYAIDATTFNSNIKINAQADIAFKLTIDYCNWNIDLGYEFWGRSAETLVCRDPFNYKYYGVKGDAQLYGFITIGLPSVPYLSIPINATQSLATIRAPQGNGNTTANFVNANADNASIFYNGGSPLLQTTDNFANTGVTSQADVNGSDQAVVLTDADINNCSGLSPRAFSNKLFGAVSRTWCNCDYLTPYIALAADVEFAGEVNGVKTALSQWGIWVRGGFNY